MGKHRSGRINEEIRKNVSAIINSKVKDPRLAGMISVTRVDVTNDFSYAKVFVSIFGSEKEKSDSMKALKKSEGFIRKELGRTISMRHIPQVIIELDEGLEYGMNIERILKEIKDK
ncbi:30S ribosome-binding factor RbfA [Oceanirhabdus sp. W0125-5]|uniref:30S ribosome-binding factor RbfA n=1 Tax=Oceanirhabdus sp. W0125-5 TaxID=2999116 RepID=UPI0022F302CF|nr:30S ribosome-binding factor RbfA [Oceanirhabdus sp. W0125-5]WBW94835.1 30S ribosome-binding factor RbfA [Oceanirhabdus sp. W0125-5]